MLRVIRYGWWIILLTWLAGQGLFYILWSVLGMNVLDAAQVSIEIVLPIEIALLLIQVSRKKES